VLLSARLFLKEFREMKALSVVAALLVLSQPVLATGLTETLVEPEVIAEEARNPSSGGFIIPLLLLAIITVITTRTPGDGIKTGEPL
jgi:hypothetical protein